MSDIVSAGTGLSRRHLLAGSAALAGLPAWARYALAQQAYRFKHGEFDITVISDGYLTLPAEIIMPTASVDERADLLKRLGGTADSAQMKTNIPVIRVGSDLILVDTGSGDKFQATAGNLVENLKAAGIDPAAITKVVFTHAHPDHSGGTLGKDGKLAFPNAAYYASAAEWQFWTNPDYKTAMPEALHPFAVGAQRDLFAVKDRVTLVKPGDEIVSGMRVLDTAGHTPGHISLELAGGAGLIITADAATNHLISFEHPDWRFGFDLQSDLAIANRKRLVDRAANERLKLLGYHWAYPGVGYAERNGSAFRFVAEA
ncbi:MBL fold metallo-hydrolase [Bosea caraganae]|uniref:MBL fold metallo-hydrolase n=1 Tax=Bosea caraganae TaxID=2763117 RepID=A0A370LDB2_9HYPH|nr:MBL fold metallo-hydrolase [Bosea caraganae]RDJ27228.1 MBL fold metallo-hydrolase [Bosea caraganae]RDJ29868.1 MBL fold metallo-hydrolase [Bosea caraganae]